MLRNGGMLGAVELGAGMLGAVERGVGSVGDDEPRGGGSDGRVIRGDGAVGDELVTGGWMPADHAFGDCTVVGVCGVGGGFCLVNSGGLIAMPADDMVGGTDDGVTVRGSGGGLIAMPADDVVGGVTDDGVTVRGSGGGVDGRVGAVAWPPVDRAITFAPVRRFARGGAAGGDGWLASSDQPSRDAEAFASCDEEESRASRDGDAS